MCKQQKVEEKNEAIQYLRIAAAVIIFCAGTFLHTSGYIRLIIFLTAYLISGADILYKAFRNLFKGKVFDENFLMGLATIGAIGIGEYPEAVMVMILYQIGEALEEKAVNKSKRSISALMDIRPDYANVEVDGKLIKKNPAEVKIGDIIKISAGEKIPLDGTIISGEAALDTSALTGESIPRKVKAGDNAISGCINTNGLLTVKVEKEFKESTVSKILELVEHSSAKKAKAENFITKFAKYYTPFVVLGAVFLSVIPPLVFNADFHVWFLRALTFLVISCPCALVISVPLGFFSGIGRASRAGILIKGACYIEALSKPYAVVFDKTGTLTKGTFKVTSILPAEGISKEHLLEIAAYAENYSSHPIANSLKEAYNNFIDEARINNVEEIAGNGIKAEIDNSEVLAGNSKLMKKYNLTVPAVNGVGTVVYVAEKGKYSGAIIISDELKPDSKEAITELNKIKCETVMLTGDAKEPAQYFANELGIKTVHSELLPAQKVEELEKLISENKGSVIFAGDGINDAPVLTRADVGIAMGALGSDAAIEAADVVIMDDKPSKVLRAILISKKTMKVVKENIIFALTIKALFLLLGAYGLITMWGAVFADVGVTLIAVLNSMRLLIIKSEINNK